MPTPSARFSPFATQKSTLSSSRREASRSSSAFRPGVPTTSAMKSKRNTFFLRQRQRCRGTDVDLDVVPRVVRVVRERLPLDAAQVEDGSELRHRRGDLLADRQRRDRTK